MDERLKDELRALYEDDSGANRMIDSFSQIEAIYFASKEAMGIGIPPKIENCNTANVKLTFNTSDLLAHL